MKVINWTYLFINQCHNIYLYHSIVELFKYFYRWSFLLWSCLLLSFLGGLVLGFLSSLLVFVYHLFVTLSFCNLSFLSFFDFSDGFFSKSFLIFSFGVLKLVNGVKSDTFNGSLLFSFIISLSLGFTNFSLFYFLMKSSPCCCPSQSLGFDFSWLMIKYLRPKFLFLLDKKRKGLPSLATNLTPLPG